MKKLIALFSSLAIILIAAFALSVTPTFASTLFSNGFETDITGWETPTRVTSGTNGITSATGAWHAEESGGDFTRWGGYNYGAGNAIPTVFQEYSTSVDIYLNVEGGWANNTRFDFSSAINNSAGTHLSDFIFNGGFYTDTDGSPGSGTSRFVISASTNSQPGSAFAKNPGFDPIAISATGWYTFEHHFYDNAGVLNVDMSIYDASHSLIKTWTRISSPTASVGGNRYGWFDFNEFSTLAFDNSQLSLVSAQPTTVKVTVNKFIDGVQATASNANSSAFPMSSTWNAVNLGSGTGSYDLDADGFNNIPTPYQAITSEMTAGADYSTYEITSGNNVGASCAEGKPFALVGYTTGDTLVAASGATLSTTIPSFTNLQSNKYVIVWNQTCVPPPSCPAGTTQSSTIETLTVPANSSVDTLSSNILANGTNYILKAYGTADAGDGITFDSRYSFRTSSSVVWTDAVSTYESYGTQLLDLLFNNSTPWGSYNSSHEYLALVAGNGAVGHFLISDIFNPNNSGEIKVDIFSCMPNIKYVTGGGNFKSGKTVTWTFGGNVWTNDGGSLVGNFELSDKVNKVNYHFNEFTLNSGNANTITFTANGVNQKTKAIVSATFTITDGGEPGKGVDTLVITGITAAPIANPLPSGQISGGNFQVLNQ